MYQGMENLSLEGPKNGDGGAGPLVRRQTTEEEDMAFFEKRYQERVCTCLACKEALCDSICLMLQQPVLYSPKL